MEKNLLEWFKRGTPPLEMDWINEYLYEIDLSWPGILRGIYFLIRENEIRYIGQSTNFLHRLGSHMKDKDIDKVYFLPIAVPTHMLEYIESRFIDFYKPPLNKTCKAEYCCSAENVIDALKLTEHMIDPSKYDTKKLNARQKELMRKSMSIDDNELGFAISKKSDELFDTHQWIGSRRMSDMKERYEALIKGASEKVLGNTLRDLALTIVVLEKRLENANTSRSIDDLEMRKGRLEADIRWLERSLEEKRLDH